MLRFGKYLTEELGKDLVSGYNKLHPGYGSDEKEFWEYLSGPSHIATFGSQAVHEQSLINTVNVHDVSDKPAGNQWQKMRDGAAAAFPQGEHPKVTKQKHQEAIAAWHGFKRDYEAKENAKRRTAISGVSKDEYSASYAAHPDNQEKLSRANSPQHRGRIISAAYKNDSSDLKLGDSERMLSKNGKYKIGEEGYVHGQKQSNIIGLALAPHTVAGGVNVCPKASTACKRDCLALHAGMNRGEGANYHIKRARTQFLLEHPEHATRMISAEIGAHERTSKKNGLEPAARLNANSDINLEHIMPQGFWDRHKSTKFYDYTKVHGRMNSPQKQEDLKHKNYHLTLSSTGTGHPESNDKHVSKHLDTGGNVAAVFRTRDKDAMPHTLVVHHPDGSQVAHPVHNANHRDDRYNDDVHFPQGGNAGHEAYLKANPHVKRGAGKVSGLSFKGNTNDEMKSTEFAIDTHHDGTSHIHL